MLTLILTASLVVLVRFWAHWYQPHHLDVQKDSSFDKEYSRGAMLFKHAVSVLIVMVMIAGWYFDGLDRPGLKLHEWIGMIMIATGACLRYWSIQTLGRHFTFELGIRDQHSLVNNGPYRWLMHPAYTGTLLIESGMTLFFAQWVIGILLMVSVAAFLYRRIRDEEQVLFTHFGDAFLAYKHDRYRLIPGVV